jgi:cellulose synthase/poly-beta-1,6-N-acetylglucosamine synthase-like glycosyltransferase
VIYFYWTAGILLGAIWMSRVIDAASGMSKLPDIAGPEWDRVPANSPAPLVSIIVPARNEHECIAQTLTSLLEQDYENSEVIAVDDRSTDTTGAIMDRVANERNAVARLKVVHISALPPGWMGKAHAMWTGAQHSTGDWLLFTDGDISFRPDSLRRAVVYAEETRADHLVLFPTLIMHSVGERMMLAFFQILFVFGHRPWKVADPHARDHMGVGAFNLIRRRAYDAVGTYRSLRFEVLDDMKLGKVVKEGGFAQRVAFGKGLITLRWAKNAMGVVGNLTKNLFSVMQFRWPLALGACLATAFLNWMPFVGIFLAPGWSRVGYLVALVAIFLIYEGVSWHTPIPPFYFFLHPLATLLFIYTMVKSTTVTLWRGGVIWRGTFYPLDQLRRGRV